MKFNDKVVDTQQLATLRDFVNVLAKEADLEFDYHFGATVHIDDRQITASHFWDHRFNVQQTGYKTDILLRVLGTLHETSVSEFLRLKKETNRSQMPYFIEQLFTLLEDIRLERLIRRRRPGTKSWFDMRRKAYHHYFETQRQTAITRSYVTDELFCLIYLSLTSESPFEAFKSSKSTQNRTLQGIKPLLNRVYEAKSTRDVVRIVLEIQKALEEDYSDMINRYFVYPIQHQSELQEERVIEELKRVDPLNNEDEDDTSSDDVINERFQTWHQENENDDENQTFMQFELDQGTKTTMIGDGARQTEEGDQAMASVQGMSAQTDQSEYEHLEDLDEKKNERETGDEQNYGKENANAVVYDRYPEKPSEADIDAYRDLLRTIDPLRRQLSQTIFKALDQKQNAERSHLLTGRLDKKQLLPLAIENESRVFYKNDLESDEIDAVFTLLIDCSASMFNKMEETKTAAILFHEVLKELKIPHNVIGFWEDGFATKENEQPNYFHRVMTFDNALQPNVGPELLQLDAEEDNRDGFTIRVATEELLERTEKDQFLLVFSDGEPSAFNYSENGIIDTNEAVIEARKKGIEVVGVFLGDGEIAEHEAMLMRNIYGREHMLVPDLSELPGSFSGILKRLLLKSI
ncbi:vWA domain-containing protein [Alkalibacillus almallahensis]|uniref:vWA domain-containing protein n=1 Tax=Alkalibacillus almallahensis TaxID=1379154 RepID=UPI00141E79C7|nr:VWA domain-containing protein [Alkalibacillus almallahensis]NIK12543.1 nitric oxide reductase activation protein [Alkalibacillus almallahensis]